MVSRTQQKSLVAYLGTCVGVVLCDRKARIGGMAHLLLPEPVSRGSDWQREVYALTGLPLFIEALCRAGARKENLEAHIAGGALIEPVLKVDLNLNIGGRNTEMVEAILRAENIPVLNSETGGYLGCSMSLDLTTWNCDIEILGKPTITPDQVEFRPPTPQELIVAIDSIRPIPQIALKIMRLIEEETHSVEEISQDIIQDQVLAARIIKLCNSPLFAHKEKIDSIERALMVIGDKRLLQLSMSLSMDEFMSQGEKGYSLCKGGLFAHAVGNAVACRKLAALSGAVSPDLAYTAGLLHDIGKIVLDQYMASAYPLFYRRIQGKGTSLQETEREFFGASHTEIGGQLARRWSMPLSLSNVIEHHHDPGQASVKAELVYTVSVADTIVTHFVKGFQLERTNAENLEEGLRAIGLTTDDFLSVIEQTTSDMSKGLYHGA